MSEVTRILDRLHQGEAQAGEELLPLVYDELLRVKSSTVMSGLTGKIRIEG